MRELNIIRNKIKISHRENKERFLENRIIIDDKENTDNEILFYHALLELYMSDFKPKNVLLGVSQSIEIVPLNRNHKIIKTSFVLKD